MQVNFAGPSLAFKGNRATAIGAETPHNTRARFEHLGLIGDKTHGPAFKSNIGGKSRTGGFLATRAMAVAYPFGLRHYFYLYRSTQTMAGIIWC